jgi:hypothetical protein
MSELAAKWQIPAEPSGRVVRRMHMHEVQNPQVGELAGDFTLPDSTGTPHTLSSLLTDGSLLLIFYRGYW